MRGSVIHINQRPFLIAIHRLILVNTLPLNHSTFCVNGKTSVQKFGVQWWSKIIRCTTIFIFTNSTFGDLTSNHFQFLSINNLRYIGNYYSLWSLWKIFFFNQLYCNGNNCSIWDCLTKKTHSIAMRLSIIAIFIAENCWQKRFAKTSSIIKWTVKIYLRWHN